MNIKLQTWWAAHRTTLLLCAIALMTLVAVLSLSLGFSDLVGHDNQLAVTKQIETGAYDLKTRYKEVQTWFAGKQVYGKIYSAVYPPASYAIFWLLIGWLPLSGVRWLWAITGMIALIWLVYLCVRASRADHPLERVLVALLPLSMLATGTAFGVGQVIVHILPMLLTGILLLCQGQQTWRRDFYGSVLVLLCLVSPIITTPFFWIVTFVPNRLGPAATISSGYLALTAIAGLFQGSNLLSTSSAAAESSLGGAAWGSTRGATVNLHTLLAALHLEKWNLPASLTVLVILGIWVYCNRHKDLWVLIGVTAIIARLWTYHRNYNNLLLLLPMIALFRIAKRGSFANQESVLAGGLIVINWLVMLIPNRILQALPESWYLLGTGSFAVSWFAMLFFLLSRTERTENC